MPRSPVTTAMLATEFRKHVRECSAQTRETGILMSEQKEAMAAQKTTLESVVTEQQAVKQALKDFNSIAWKAVGAVGLVLFTAVVGIGAQNWFMHGQTVNEVSSKTAAVTTINNTARDAQYRMIMDRLDKMGVPK